MITDIFRGAGLFTCVCNGCGHSIEPVEFPTDVAINVEQARWQKQLEAAGWKIDSYNDALCPVCKHAAAA